jgi:hypothetical protein
MTDTPRPPMRASLGSVERRGLFGLDTSETVFAGVWASAGTLVCLVSGGSAIGFAGLLLGLAVPGVAVLLPYRGRTPFRQLPIDARFWWGRLTGSSTYRSGVREAGVDLGTNLPVEVVPPAAIGDIRWLSVAVEGGDLAVHVHPDGGVTACWEVTGPAIGLFDRADHEAAWNRWSGVLSDTANGSTLVDRLSALELCRPGDPRGHEGYLAERGSNTAPSLLCESYAELHGRIGTVIDDHRNYVAFRLGPGMALTRSIRLAGGGDVGLGALVAREAAALADRLRAAQLTVARPVDPARAASLIRASYDPAHQIDSHSTEMPRTAWPVESIEHDDGLEVNQRWRTAVGWVKRWPLRGGGVNFLAPLLVQTPGMVRTIAVTFALVPTDLALQRALGDITVDEAEARRRFTSGKIDDPRSRHQRGQAEIRAEDLAAGAAGIRVVGYVSVSAPTTVELADERGRLLRSAARSDVVIEWCDREHGRFLPAVLPWCRGIR